MLSTEKSVTLKIEVKDGEVSVATANLGRLQTAAQNVGKGGAPNLKAVQNDVKAIDGSIDAAAKRLGISYDQMVAKMRTASTSAKSSTTGFREADKAMGDTADAAADLAVASSGAGSSLAGLASKAGPIGLAIAGIAVVMLGVVIVAKQLADKIFELAKAFADYALSIGKSAQETGLMAETVSALEHEAARFGTTFDSLKSPIENFRKLIGQAIAGSTDASSRLKALGIDAITAGNNIDQAFKSAIATIVSAKNPVDQIRLAYAAFGDEGYKLLPFFRSFNGDVDAAIKRAEELGIVIGGKDVEAAKEFNKNYTDLNAVIKGISNTFGREFLPLVNGVLQKFGTWLTDNKTEIKGWAEWSASWIQVAIDRWTAFFNLIDRSQKASQSYDLTYAPDGTMIPVPRAATVNQPQPKPGTRDQIEGRQPTRTPVIDPAVEAARLAELEKRRKTAFDEAQKRAKALAELIQDLTNRNKHFGDTTEVTATQLRLEALGIKDLTQGTAQYALQLAAMIDKKKKDAEADKQRKKDLEDYQKALTKEKQSVLNESYFANVDLGIELNQLTEQIKLGRELSEVKKAELAIDGELLKYRRQLATSSAGYTEADINAQVALKETEAEHTREILAKVEAKKALIAQMEKEKAISEQVKSVTQSLEDEILVLSRGGIELSRHEQAVRAVNDEYKDWSAQQKQQLLDLAAQADAIEELNRQHAELKAFFAESLSYVFEGDFKGLFENFARRIKDNFIDKLSDIFATSVLGFDPNQTDNPVAKPIVSTITKSNQKLDTIITLLGGNPGISSIGGGGGIGSIFSMLGLGGSSGQGPGGTPVFNPGAGSGVGGSGSGGNWLQTLLGSLGGGGHEGQHSGSGGGILGNLKNLFSTKPGGIFGSEGFGNNAGTYGAIGSIATLIGGMVGGRTGSVISGAGSGLSMGAMIGSFILPGIGTAVGAALGAAIGAIVGFFTGKSKDKIDKKENMPKLNAGFTEAFKMLRETLDGVRRMTIDPDTALDRAKEIRAEIASGFGVKFESKTYRRKAQQLIASKLTEADTIIAEIRAASEISRGAAERSKRILPEFAIGQYLQPNGLLPGAFDGRDNILAMISRGEMVLNPMQQNRVRALAGHDVFAGAGIPNYPKASPSPKLALGGIAGAGLPMPTPQVTVNPNMTLVLQGATFNDDTRAYLMSDDGRRTTVKVIKEERKYDRNL